MTNSETQSKSRKSIIILVVLLIPLLIVLGLEGYRKADESASVDEVEETYEDTLTYFGDPDDWNEHFRKRRGTSSGYDDYHALGQKFKDSHGEQTTDWVIGSIRNTEKQPTAKEAESFLSKSSPVPGQVRVLLKFDALDGASDFRPDGEAGGNITGIRVLRALQLRVILLQNKGNRAQAMSELELLLEVTSRLQTPFGLIELLLMEVGESTTHILVGHMAESGALSERCDLLLKKIADSPESRLEVAEGELAYFAWMYKVNGIDALTMHSKGGESGGSSGWFQWLGGESFGGVAEFNREIAENQRSLLNFCEDLKADREPTPGPGTSEALATSFPRSYKALHLHRDRSLFVVQIRKAMSGGDPAKLADEIKKAGMLLTEKPEGWEISLTGQEELATFIGTSVEDIKLDYAPLLLRK